MHKKTFPIADKHTFYTEKHTYEAVLIQEDETSKKQIIQTISYTILLHIINTLYLKTFQTYAIKYIKMYNFIERFGKKVFRNVGV